VSAWCSQPTSKDAVLSPGSHDAFNDSLAQFIQKLWPIITSLGVKRVNMLVCGNLCVLGVSARHLVETLIDAARAWEVGYPQILFGCF